MSFNFKSLLLLSDTPFFSFAGRERERDKSIKLKIWLLLGLLYYQVEQQSRKICRVRSASQIHQRCMYSVVERSILLGFGAHDTKDLAVEPTSQSRRCSRYF